MEHIRKKNSADGKKTRITMAGPIGLGGALNTGNYSIENLWEYMLTMASDYLGNIFEQWGDNVEARHDIHLLIRGHSRGGVDATQNNEKHRCGYTDAATGEVYRSSGINDLPEGLYVVDEQNTLIRMTDYKQTENILNTFVKDTKDKQKNRHEVVLKSVRNHNHQ